ncbi:hypothetical protein FB451DRAFT_1393752 [Mycena latifolia]|nr:hypothetical protein FB451DRAFT_1393752 [Mycena latifolia]
MQVRWRSTFKLQASLLSLCFGRSVDHLWRTPNCGYTLLCCHGANTKMLALVLQRRWLPFDSALDCDAVLYSVREVGSGRGPLARPTPHDSPSCTLNTPRLRLYDFLHGSTSAVSPLLLSPHLVRKIRCMSSLCQLNHYCVWGLALLRSST